MDNPLLMYFLIALFSLMVGSLLNVIIHRLPIMIKSVWEEECREFLSLENSGAEKKVNLFYPRSFCPKCKNMITAWQNIPIVSYIFLKGRCFHCKQPISLRYPLVELMTVVLSVYSAWHFGPGMALVFVLLFTWIIICLIFIDFDYQLLPDTLTLSLLWLGLIANAHGLFTPLPNAVLSAAGAYLVLWLFIQLFYLITGKIGMGNGDFKLFAALGAWFGWTQLPLILLISSLSGAIVGIIYLRLQKKSRDTAIPFGPFLCIAGLVSLFWGDAIITWYLQFF